MTQDEKTDQSAGLGTDPQVPASTETHPTYSAGEITNPCFYRLHNRRVDESRPTLPYGDVGFRSLELDEDEQRLFPGLYFQVVIDLEQGRRICLSISGEDSRLICEALNAYYRTHGATQFATGSVPAQEHAVELGAQRSESSSLRSRSQTVGPSRQRVIDLMADALGADAPNYIDVGVEAVDALIEACFNSKSSTAGAPPQETEPPLIGLECMKCHSWYRFTLAPDGPQWRVLGILCACGCWTKAGHP